MGYNPQYEKKQFQLECPMKYSTPENGVNCVKSVCAWWMPIQRACCKNVQARQYTKPFKP